MKTFSVGLAICLASSLLPPNARATILFDWTFTNSGQIVGPADALPMRARITNEAGSDENLTFDRFVSASFGISPPASDNYSIIAFPFIDLAGLDLSPGDSFDFDFGELNPLTSAAPGDYVLDRAGLTIISELPDVETQIQPQNFRWTVRRADIPEPSTLWLLATCLAALGFRVIARRARADGVAHARRTTGECAGKTDAAGGRF